jgi:hypothetical protein
VQEQQVVSNLKDVGALAAPALIDEQMDHSESKQSRCPLLSVAMTHLQPDV